MVMGKGMGKVWDWDAVCMMGSRGNMGGCCELNMQVSMCEKICQERK